MHRDICALSYTEKMRCKIVLLLFAVAALAQAKEETFIWADDQDYAPYIYIDSTNKVGGIFNDIMTAVFAEMPISLNTNLYPWKRAQRLVKEAKADGMVTIPTENRLEFLVATQPLVHVDMKVHFNKKNLKSHLISRISSLEQLKPYDIIEYQGDGWAESQLKGFNVKWAPNYTSAVWMIAANRGDIFLDDPISVKYHINKQISLNPELADKLLLIKHGGHTIYSAPHCLLIRKDSPFSLLIPEFNKALSTIRNNGTYEKILNKYIKLNLEN